MIKGDLKKIAEWIKDIKYKIQNYKEKEVYEVIKYVVKVETVYLRKRTIGRNKLQPYENDKEWIVTRRIDNIYEIQLYEGKLKVINKENLKLCKPKYMDCQI